MSRLLRRTPRVLLAVFGLLFVSGAISFAQHSTTAVGRFLGSLTEVLPAQDIASNRPLVKILLRGVVERNQKQIAIENAGPVKPGEVVRFTMNSVNEGSSPARDYRAVGQIPKGTAFVANSAGGANARVSYSIDNGKQFSAQPMIDEKQSDGSIKKVAAPVSLYTQVRFEWADPLAAGGKLVTSYQVRVK